MRLPFRAALLAALSLFAAIVPAQAELMIAPTRVLLGGTTRTAELVLVNKGTETAAFRLALENRRMKRDGSLEAAPAAQPGELFAADKVRFSPRQVILEPGARQVVRVSADLPADLAPGEYRSHLRLMSAPTSAGRTVKEPTAGDDRSLSIELIAVRSITIPVIVRVGALESAVTVDGASLSGKPDDMLVVKMERRGSRSTYGDLRLTVEGEAAPAWIVLGVAIYTPNTERDVVLPLPKDVRQKIAGQKVRIDYVSTDPAAPGSIAVAKVQL